MFDRARRRLTVQAALLITVLMVVFSVVFFAALYITLEPTFDLVPEIPDGDAARLAFDTTVGLIAVALLIANLAAITIAVLIGYLLAGRTLRPIGAALERQRRFVADASHEMRTPLTIVRANLDATHGLSVEPEAAAESLRAIADATDRMSRITADLLLLAQAEDGSLRRAATQTDLSVTVAEAVDAARAGLGAEIDLRLAPDLIILADQETITRVVTNLLDNAWRYSDGALITVRTRGIDRWVVLEVEDRGDGIPAQDLERIFQPFRRLRGDRGAPSGTGLGLAIVRGLVRELGGSVSVTSRIGHGSIFRVELPRHR